METGGIIAKCSIVLLVALIIVGCGAGNGSSSADFELLQRELRDGDLLFRRGIGVMGRAVVAADDGGKYSHVGIAVRSDSGWCVVHAVPDEPDFKGDFDRVKCEPIESFYGEFRAANGAVYRSDLSNEMVEVIIDNALRLSSEKRRFDHDYCLEDTTEMYCTELVEYLYGRCGVSISEGRRTYVNFPSMTGYYIMPSDLIRNEKLTFIYSF